MNLSIPFSGLTRYLLCFTALSLAAENGLAASKIVAAHLRCEYLSNPTAVGPAQPRLSWIVEGGKNRGVRQSAYQILVASGPEMLTKAQGDVWDSGRTTSDQSVQIVYGGQELASGRTYFWKVKLWDEQGEASTWSEPGQWTMGLLKATDWKAKWIGYDA